MELIITYSTESLSNIYFNSTPQTSFSIELSHKKHLNKLQIEYGRLEDGVELAQLALMV